MMEYRVVASESLDSLSSLVNLLIEGGWIPQGGIAVSKSESDSYSYSLYAQAMTRETPQGEMP